MQRPVRRSQVRIVLSSEADSRNLPEGWNTNARIQLSSVEREVSSARFERR